MARYPGQQPRRWPLVVVGGAVVMLAGLGTGWALSGRASGSPTTNSPGACPGGRDDAGRRAAAVCLVTSYFALENSPPTARDAKLAGLVRPSALDSARASYKALDAKVSTEYAAVAATNLTASSGGSAASGQAWVAFVDSYRDGSAPFAQWWITTFDLRWQDGRWWLDGGVATQVDATPQTAGTAPRAGFGPGWVAAGGG
jgi:hypothetical protein